MGLTGDMLADGPEGPHRMDEIQAGDRIWSYVDGRLELRAVTAPLLSKSQEVFEVRFTKGRMVTASANHSFLVAVKMTEKRLLTETGEWSAAASKRQRQGARGVDPCSVSTCTGTASIRNLCIKHYHRWQKHGDPRVYGDRKEAWAVKWMRLDGLRRGDMVIRNTTTPDMGQLMTLPDGREFVPDVAWLIGLIHGDGNVDPGHRVRLSVFDPDVRRRVNQVWRQLTSHSPREYPYPAPMYLNSASFTRMLEQLGMCVLGPQKRVPRDVRQWPRQLQRAFLDGYCDADGCRTQKGSLRSYTSASRSLVAEVRALHIAHGDSVSNLSHRRREGRTGPGAFAGSKDSWEFDVYAGINNGGGLRDREGLRALVSSWDGQFSLSRVQSVTSRGEQGSYAITVEGLQGFSVNGIHVQG